MTEATIESTYEALYDIVEKRLQEHDRQMLCRKEVYLFSLHNKPGVCDGEKLSALSSNADFFQGAFLSLLNRLPDEAVSKTWEMNIKTRKPEEFQAELMEVLLSSPEAVMKSSVYVNNEITKPRLRKKQPLENLIQSGTDEKQEAAPVQSQEQLGFKDRLYKVYLKLPESVRRVAHRIVRGK